MNKCRLLLKDIKVEVIVVNFYRIIIRDKFATASKKSSDIEIEDKVTEVI